MEWDVGKRWDAHSQYECERTSHTDAILCACDELRRVESLEDARQLAHSITQCTMANHDRTTVELNTMRQVVREELVDSRVRTLHLLYELHNGQNCTDDQGAALSRAMTNVLQVQSSLRGVYPHISYAHAHPMDDVAMS